MRDLCGLSYQEVVDYLQDIGEKAFRADQIFEWVYQKDAKTFAEVKTLPAALRQALKRDMFWDRPRVAAQARSDDGTVKFLLELKDKERIEAVLIPAGKRATVCVSTQVGCKYGCRFCASGVGGWVRDLSCAEIVQQVLCAKGHNGGRPVTHVVFMGTGEPLDNYEQVLRAVRIINDGHGLGIGARRITLSTCGVIPGMQCLAREKLQVELAVSLHGFDERSRSALMPVNHKYSLSELIGACRKYVRETNRQVTFEYILVKDLTCSAEAGRALGRLLNGLLCKLNLIMYNEVEEFDFQKPSARDVLAFRRQLDRYGVYHTLRRPRGQDVSAACGQLRHKETRRDVTTRRDR